MRKGASFQSERKDAPFLCFVPYSYRSASIGFSSEAFHAG